MGEEQKEEEKKEQEEKKEEEPPEIVLKVDMHCEGCARKVARSLRRFEGVEDVKTDSKSKIVVVKGKAADPAKICERVQKKTGKKVELISPLPPPPPEEEKKEETQEAQEEEKKEPEVITVILKVRMHCEACAQVLQKRIKKMEGVESVITDLANSQVIVKGTIDPAILVENLNRRMRKQASIVQDEEKKEEESKPAEEEKKEEATEEEKKEEGEDIGEDVKKYEYWPARAYIEYYPAYPPEMFSDENPNACSVM
ncbi:heavy metal-associated isoprenylated plant protein 7-like [Typha angustifolia]|uniref:heavy metal-associated isoprenylated plant protein 7-like n=1 Tax=Typha angustifolia TaxID=59011 RepID=UPI003C2BC1DC